MKRLCILMCLLALPSVSAAIGFEVAVGGWSQDPSGTLGYKGDSLGLSNDFRYGKETRLMGRAKIDMPLVIPNVYLMYTPMSFSGAGSKSFAFAGRSFTGDFTSELTLDHLDVALYYGIPGLKTLTLGILNVDVGLNARLIDFEARVDQDAAGIHESKSASLPIPMLYAGVQVKPIKALNIEAEGRGISYSGNQLYSAIGRLKIKPPIPLLFIAAGYRLDKVKIDEEDIKVDSEFSGPFAEAGIQF